MIECEYIFHDGFILSRAGEWAVIFDFWKDPRGMERLNTLLRSGIPVYVVVSHHHKDHFVAGIFDWCAIPGADVRYVISGDVMKHCGYRLRDGSSYKGVHVPPDRLTVLCPGEKIEIGALRFEAFASTDIGNSYVVTDRSTGFTTLHAGDLNAWLWLDESTDEEVAEMEGRYEKILGDIAGRYPKLDLALFPVDSRMGREYWTGARMLLSTVDVRIFVPMHFGLGVSPEESERLTADALCFGEYVPAGCRTVCCGLTASGDKLSMNGS